MTARTAAPHRAPFVHLVSLGCAKNLVDSETLLGRLAAAGAVLCSEPEDAEILIVNTCGFIEAAKRESLDAILALARFKRRGACRKLLVMGCLAQRYKDELRRAMPEVDGFFGVNEQRGVVAACGLARRAAPCERLLLTPRHSAYLRISEGCDNRCAYCAIPLIRGPYRSRPFGEIVSEAESLVASGVRELNVIGQDTTRYGTDHPRWPRIADLLARLGEIRGVRWVRLLYTHPAHFSDALIAAYAALPKLCPYVDLPLQHLNDAILRRMGRKVTRSEIERLIERLRVCAPGVAIRTAFIVGFPGETRAQFRELLDGVKALRFDHLGAFAYSREDGTPAARMRGHVSKPVRARRLRELMLTQQRIVFALNAARKGQTTEAVVDAAGARSGEWICRTPHQAPDVDSATIVRGDRLRPGRFLRVHITGARGYDLIARPVAPRALGSPRLS